MPTTDTATHTHRAMSIVENCEKTPPRLEELREGMCSGAATATATVVLGGSLFVATVCWAGRLPLLRVPLLLRRHGPTN